MSPRKNRLQTVRVGFINEDLEENGKCLASDMGTGQKRSMRLKGRGQ